MTPEQKGWEVGQSMTAGVGRSSGIEIGFVGLLLQLAWALVVLAGKAVFYIAFGAFLAAAWLWKKATRKEVYS